MTSISSNPAAPKFAGAYPERAPLYNAAVRLAVKIARKLFFSEEKNQKTFTFRMYNLQAMAGKLEQAEM